MRWRVVLSGCCCVMACCTALCCLAALRCVRWRAVSCGGAWRRVAAAWGRVVVVLRVMARRFWLGAVVCSVGSRAGGIASSCVVAWCCTVALRKEEALCCVARWDVGRWCVVVLRVVASCGGAVVMWRCGEAVRCRRAASGGALLCGGASLCGGVLWRRCCLLVAYGSWWVGGRLLGMRWVVGLRCALRWCVVDRGSWGIVMRCGAFAADRGGSWWITVGLRDLVEDRGGPWWGRGAL